MSGERRTLPLVLAVLAAVAVLGSVVVGYTTRALFDPDEFADRAVAALEDDAVAGELGRRATNDVVANEPDLVAIRPVIEDVITGVISSKTFRDLFRAGVADVHRTLFEQDSDTFTLALADIGATARGAVAALNPKLAKKIPANSAAEVIEGDPPEALVKVVQVADEIEPLPWLLLALAAILAGVAVWISRDRRATVLALGVAVGICAVLAVVGLNALRAILLTAIQESGARDAADGVWSAYLGDLSRTLYLVAAAGAVTAAASSSLLRPVDIGAPLRRAGEVIAATPEGTGARAARAVALLAVGIFMVVRPDTVLHLVAILAGLYVAYAGAGELMRLTLVPIDAEARATQGRRALAVGGVTAALILLAGAIFIGVGGIKEEPAAIETEGCNGSDALCDRAIDETAMAATHNAMSAETYPNWLFAQQEAGLGDQLRDGVRALLIDAHYGQLTESGTVKTDLSDIDRGERAAYEDELGTEALDAALRIRDRIIDSPTVGPPGVYLCHRFCELGAITIEHGFSEIRDFLAANPDEVIVVVIEDYVAAKDIAAAAEDTGLIDYVYMGAPDAAPTLGEMIESGGRAVIMAEQDSGDVPWYHEAYAGLVEETPYSFKTPSALIDPDKLVASCEPNRGSEGSPFFLLNHWVDTSPAPKPSNASEVNAHEPLLRRIRECEDLREHRVNLVAVDFYRQGDVFGVARELNEDPE
jgi:hypothetical protein